MKTAVVIPTCRPEMYRRWRHEWRQGDPQYDSIYPILDSISPSDGCFCWEDIDQELGENAWIISRNDSAIRSFGFYLAWKDGADLILTLDDDCLPTEHGNGNLTTHAYRHFAAMEIPVFRSTLPDIRVRGMPYNPAPQVRPVQRSQVNIGLWSGVADLDAPTQLANPSYMPPTDFGTNYLLPGQYAPMCGMNLAFTRQVAPLMYFGLQGLNQPVARFDDIWCGILAKRISDHLGWLWTFGKPIVRHARASDPLRNLIKESPGIAEHETYWQYVAAMQFTANEPVGCMIEAAKQIARYKPGFLPLEYFARLAIATETWARLFE